MPIPVANPDLYGGTLRANSGFSKPRLHPAKQDLLERICKALTIHAMLEEEIFYPACREKIEEDDPLNEAQVEHDSAKLLIADLWDRGPSDQFRDAKVKVLSEQVHHHVAEEERQRSGILDKAAQAGVNMAALGSRIAERKAELEGSKDIAPGMPVAIRGISRRNGEMSKESMMPNMQQSRGDDRGRWFGDSRGHAEAARRGCESRH